MNPEKTVVVAVAIEFDVSTAAGIALEYKNNLIAGGINESDIILITVSRGSTTFYSEGGNRRRRSSGGGARIIGEFSSIAVTADAAQLSSNMTVSDRDLEVVETIVDAWCPNSNGTATITSFEGTRPGSSFFTGCNFTARHLIIRNASIPDNAFDGCSDIETVELDSSVTSIPDNAFRSTSNLASINFNYVESIGDGAFHNSDLTGLTLQSNSLTSLGRNAFFGTKIEHVNLPNLTVVTGPSTFNWCTQLQTVQMNSLVETGVYIQGYLFRNTRNLISVQMLSLTVLNSGDFGSSNVQIIDMPSLTGIVAGAFTNANQLRTIDLRHVQGGFQRSTSIVFGATAACANQTFFAGTNIINCTAYTTTTTAAPSAAPSSSPTPVPTTAPTASPTPVPTTSSSPTPAPTTAPPTTASPTSLPAPTASPEPADDDDVSPGLIAGIAGGVAALGLIILAVKCWPKKTKVPQFEDLE